MTGTLHEDVFTFMKISRWVFFIVRNFSNKSRENKNTHFMSNNFFSKNRAVCDRIVEECGACALHAGLVKLNARKHTPAHIHPPTHTHTHTHTHSLTTVEYLLLVYSNSAYANASECYVVRTLSVLLCLWLLWLFERSGIVVGCIYFLSCWLIFFLSACIFSLSLFPIHTEQASDPKKLRAVGRVFWFYVIS